MKKISVIIPYKDEAKYIKDCVSTIPESAEIEILLVADDGEETVPQWFFEDQRISVILPEEGKGGVAACRNLGIQKARGEYVYFLDADDYVAEPALSALMEAAGEERLLLTGPVAYSWYSPINYTPDRIQWENEELVQEEKEAYPMTEKDWEKRFATLISARHMMIKRSFLLENQICFSEDEIWHTDVGFMMEVLSGAYEKSYMVPQALYVSRYRNDPVHFPSLTQQENKESVQDYKVQYEAGKGSRKYPGLTGNPASHPDPLCVGAFPPYPHSGGSKELRTSFAGNTGFFRKNRYLFVLEEKDIKSHPQKQGRTGTPL